jgi:hypothetical protein
MIKEGIFAKRNFVFLVNFVFVFIVLSGLSYASSGVVNLSKTEYYPGEKIEGNLTIQFVNELVSSNVGFDYSGAGRKNFQIYDLIKLKNHSSYSCTPSDCEDRYSLLGIGTTQKNINLNTESLSGFIIEGRDISINDFSFSVSSNAPASCSNQLRFDFLDDGKLNWINDKAGSDFCDVVKSDCHNNIFPHKLTIDAVPYCENIILPESPSILVSAGIEKIGGIFYQGIIFASVYDSFGNLVGKCDLSMPVAGVSSCSIDYTNNKRGSHYVCVSLKEGETTEAYKLGANIGVSKCGFRGDPAVFPEKTANYNIFLRQRKFDAVGSFVFNPNSFAKQNEFLIRDYIREYIHRKYLGDCTEKCIIPMKIEGVSQNLVISNININYDSLSGRGFSSANIYDLSKSASFVNSSALIFNLSYFNLTVPSATGESNFSVYIGNRKVFEKEIVVLSNETGEVEEEEEPGENIEVNATAINFSVSPLSVAFKKNNTFSVAVENRSEIINDSVVNSSAVNVSAYYWKFGNDSIIKTGAGEIVYFFNESGKFRLNLSVEYYENGTLVNSSRVFEIISVNPAEILEKELERYKNQTKIIKIQIEGLPEKYQTELKKKLDIEKIEEEINESEERYLVLKGNPETTAEQFNLLLDKVKKIDFVVSISLKNISQNYVFNKDKINTEYIEKLFSIYYMGDVQKEEMAKFLNENLDVKIIHRSYSINYEGKTPVVFISEFEFEVVPKKDFKGNVYFVVNQRYEGLIFKEDYDFSRVSSDSLGIKFLGMSDKQVFSFAIAEAVGISGLEYFFVTELSNLPKPSIIRDVTGSSDIWMFFLILFLVFVIFILVYIFLQEWYKRNYERVLFSDKTKLYNLIFFIKNAVNQGLSESDMRKALRNSQWKSEQISYAINKFYGRRTGMWEIPVMRFFEKRKIDREMKKREGFR